MQSSSKTVGSKVSLQSATGSQKLEKIEITVIPVDEEPYSKTISVPVIAQGKTLIASSDFSNFKLLGSSTSTPALQ